jgi:glycosyltransferase involved in cell wall biosynthesis
VQVVKAASKEFYMDKVSIIIPTKDRLPQLKKAIPLYLKEPEVGEVIIVIDGSTDGTRE